MGSEWKQGSIERRDFRSSKSGPEVARKKSKKDTKKWCKGKVGVEHQLNRVPWKGAPNIADVDECTKCGKNFGFFMKAGCDV
jgi:hypothetical protein